jgi:heterotetrameric sarcosine oxidase gamma subunit
VAEPVDSVGDATDRVGDATVAAGGDQELTAPVARSPIPAAAPLGIRQGWQVSIRHTEAALRLMDASPVAKVLVRAGARTATAAACGVSFGRAAPWAGVGGDGLVAGCAPNEWLVLAEPGWAEPAVEALARAGGDELATVVDVTHARALIRLSGADAAAVLAKLCALDLAESAFPHRAAVRAPVAGVVCELVRADTDAPSYLLACESIEARWLFGALVEAGRELGLDIEGFEPAAALRCDTAPKRSATSQGG